MLPPRHVPRRRPKSPRAPKSYCHPEAPLKTGVVVEMAATPHVMVSTFFEEDM